MGRPEKPIELHTLAGTVPRAKQPATVFALKPGRAKIPGHLSPAARSEFKKAQRILSERGHATSGDFVTLSLYAEAMARWIFLKADLQPPPVGRGMLIRVPVTDSNGAVHWKEISNPSRKDVSAIERQILALAKALGLTAVDRDKVRPTAGSVAQIEADKKAPPEPGTVAWILREQYLRDSEKC